MESLEKNKRETVTSFLEKLEKERSWKNVFWSKIKDAFDTAFFTAISSIIFLLLVYGLIIGFKAIVGKDIISYTTTCQCNGEE